MAPLAGQLSEKHPMLTIHISNKRQNQHLTHPTGPLEFGRGPQRAAKRVLLEDIYVSRDQFVIEAAGQDKIRVENLSAKRDMTLSDGTVLQAGARRELPLPVFFSVGETLISIDRDGAEEGEHSGLQTIAQPVARAAPSAGATLLDLGEAPSPEKLTHWMERVLGLQQSAADTADFFKQTARSLVEMIGLDVGMVVLRDDDDWSVRAGYAADDRGTMRYSRTLVNQVYKEKRTFFQDLEALAEKAESLQAVDAVVASPIFGLQGDVVGVVYGQRTRAVLGRLGVRPLEAQIVQLLAGAVGAHLARSAAVKTRVQFEMFFSTELVRELERNPNLLEGRAQEVTVLVSDLRGFTSMAERLGAATTCQIIRDLMEHLTERILQYGGVIVDYAGDGILAMWNAPVQQSDHALRACRAARAMQAVMPVLNQEWQSTLGAPLKLGIGVNTGPAHVGNIGCSRKFKYGAHGHTVNLASRVQDATKKLGFPILITDGVRSRIGSGFATVLAGRIELAGVKEPTPLYELREESASVTQN